MSEEDQNNLDFLSKQYRRKLIELKNNEKIIKLKNKFLIVFLIVFIYTITSIFFYVYNKYENEFFKNIISVSLLFLNGYVYIYFASSYIENAEKESDNVIIQIEDISAEIDILLEKYKIDKEEYYSKLELNIINN